MKSLKAVLLVEDNPGDARLLREMFNEHDSHDSELSHVASMSEAEKYLSAHIVGLILLDLGLPDVSGLEAIRRMPRPGRSELTDCTTPGMTTRSYSYFVSRKSGGETETGGGSTSAPRADIRASTIAGAAPPEEARPATSPRQPVAGGICPGARVTRIPPVES